MAPSLIKTIGVVAAAYATGASALKYSYKPSEVYNSTNFFDKFSFFESVLGTGVDTDIDPTNGYVQYQSRQNAEKLNLISTDGEEIYIGPDYTSNYDPDSYGRKSVRLESLNTYTHGLIIADFAHLPKPTCGLWPAFWMYGDPWPTKGEIDILENWNDLEFNRNTAHVDSPSVIGDCTISASDFSAVPESLNCWNDAPDQYSSQGCSADQTGAPFGSSSGGVYCLEWTSDYLKIWSWSHSSTPLDITLGVPLPSTWGLPQFEIKNCDIDKAFSDMKIVLNIDFCGVAGQDGIWTSTCQASTTYDTCKEYVASEPSAFESSYFKINDIIIYQSTEDVVTSTSSTSTPTSTSSSTKSSTTSSAETTTTSSAKTTTSSSTKSSTTSSAKSTTTSSTASSEVYPTSSSTTSSAKSTTTSSAESTTNSSTSSSEVYPTSSSTTSKVSSSKTHETTSSKVHKTTSSTYATEIISSASETYPVSDISSSSTYSVSSEIFSSKVVTVSSSATQTRGASTSSATSTCTDEERTTYPALSKTSSSKARTISYPATTRIHSESTYSATSTCTDEESSTYSIASSPYGVSTTTKSYTVTKSSGYPVSKITSSGKYSQSTVATESTSSKGYFVSGTYSTAAATTSTASTEYTTSTVYTTKVHTTSSGRVVTETISLYTTVCPVTETGGSSKPTTTPSVPTSYVTSTHTLTTVYTISGSTTSEVLTTVATYPIQSSETCTEDLTSTTTSTHWLSTTVYVKPSSVSSSSEAVTYVAATATVVPVNYTGSKYNATLAYGSSPKGTTTNSASIGKGSGSTVVVSSGSRTGLTSVMLVAVIGIFFL